MNMSPRSASSQAHNSPVPNFVVGRVAKVKALEPISSTCSPRLALVTECSPQGIIVRVRRYLTVGTVVQLHLEGEFSLWKVLCCSSDGRGFNVGLELLESVSA